MLGRQLVEALVRRRQLERLAALLVAPDAGRERGGVAAGQPGVGQLQAVKLFGQRDHDAAPGGSAGTVCAAGTSGWW